MTGTRVALVSLEPWDDVWRRNQHLASRVAERDGVRDLLFLAPPGGGATLRGTRSRPRPAVEVRTPAHRVPRRLGGHVVLGRWARRAAAAADVLWVNDPVAGAAALRPGRPTVYDVTDDWRTLDQPARDRDRVVAAEDLLARSARTVVCSDVLADRWRDRYDVRTTVIGNGVDLDAVRGAVRHRLPGPGPHVLYAGTLHTSRLDVDLVLDVAAARGVGTVHLVGPDHLDDVDRARLDAAGVRRHGPVPARDVASWLVSADVLVCPHRVDPFTLSLDAIKAHEYLATDRPVVATPSSGFQALRAPGLQVLPDRDLAAGVVAATRTGPTPRPTPASWDDRAAEFAAVLDEVRR